MIKPKFINEYGQLTTKRRWRDLRAVFAVINDIGDRLQLIEEAMRINSSMANDEGNVGNVGNVGAGSTAPVTPHDDDPGNVGVGSTAPVTPHDDDPGNVGIGTSA